MSCSGSNIQKMTAFSPDPSDGDRPARRYELDLLRAVSTVSMILCHAVLRLGAHRPGHEGDLLFWIGDVFFGCYPGVAHAFMFAMGVGINYSHRDRPVDLVRRGISLYILAFLLNFLRYGVYALVDGLIEGEFAAETVYALVVQDILHFAGLALIATGLFKWLRLKAYHMLIVGAVLSAAGGLLAFSYQGSPVMNYLLGHFVTTTEEASCFVFFNWYIFVASGLLFGGILLQSRDADGLYRKLFFVACPIALAYIVLSIIFGPFFLTKNRWYYALCLPDAVGLLSLDLTLLSLFHFLLKRVDASRFSVCIEMSRNVNQIYLVHWCILGFIDSIFCYLLGFVFPYPVIYLIGVLLILVSCWIADRWRRRKTMTKPKQEVSV